MSDFKPHGAGLGLSLTVGAASVNGAIPGTGNAIQFTNDEAFPIQVTWGPTAAPVATAAYYVIQPYSKESWPDDAVTLYAGAIQRDGNIGKIVVHRGYLVNKTDAV